MTGPPVEGADNFVPMVLGSLENAATMHHCHTPEIALTSPVTATGIWAMEDWIIFGNGNELHGAGHYHLRKAGRHLADQDAAPDPDHPADHR
jgi:hypothetical protein